MNKTKRYTTIIFMIILTAMLSVNISTVKAADSPARAASLWQVFDGFEANNPLSVWSCWIMIANPLSTCKIESSQVQSRSGLKSARIYAYEGWVDWGRKISITPFMAGRSMTCVAQIYVKSLPGGLNNPIQLDVIDVPTWRYTSIKKVTDVPTSRLSFLN